jgi:hypothetical protein
VSRIIIPTKERVGISLHRVLTASGALSRARQFAQNTHCQLREDMSC